MSFVAELKRRNVARAALLYVVAAWLIMQIADVLFAALELPPWSVRLVLGLLVLGFPLTMIFAWVFELTPEGLKREHEVDRNESITHETARKINVLIVVLLVAAVGLLIFNRLMPTKVPAPIATTGPATAPGETTSPQQGASTPAQAPAVAASDPSIAVLPFVNMSGDADNEYFSDGLSEELLNVLAKIPGLRVIARTSSFAFKGEKTDIATVAAKLAVAHVLEGSVRKAGGRVRITAQLIRAADSSHLWSDTYDRGLEDVFAVQDEIAKEVAEELKLRLLPGAAGSAEVGSTSNPKAHDLYLKTFAPVPGMGMRESVTERLAMADQALALDPDFARAHAQRADLLRIMTTNGWIPPGEGYAQARGSVARALELAPELDEAFMVRGWISMVTLDLRGAKADIERAMQLNPGNARVQLAFAYYSLSLGKLEQAVRAARLGLSLDPLSAQTRNFFGTVLRFARQYPEAEQVLSALVAERADTPNAHFELGLLALAKGDPKRALAEFEAETVEWKHATGLALAWHALGEQDKAQEGLAALLASGDPDWSAVQQAQIASQWGDADTAFKALETAFRVGDPALGTIRVDPLVDPIREDPRFAKVLARLNFPD